ncbi:MAG TPA: hypothetical protein VN519_16635 [Bryobacteraceae bacterium]|nr:hypothetical protein [Bryobacteraceae bacterium]
MIALIVIYGSYLVLGGHIVVTVLALSLIQIGVYIALCREPKDERDRLIESKSYRIGYLVMAVGVVFCMADREIASARGLLLTLMAAETGKSLTQLISYRRGV